MLFLLYVYIIYIMFVTYALTKKSSILNNYYISRFFEFNLIFISTFIIAMTDISYIDRAVYSNRFLEIANLTLIESINLIDWEPLFIILMKSISLFTSNVIIFYIILHLVFLFILLSGLNKIFSDNKIKVLILFTYLNYIFYFSYTLNGLRQGFAMVLIILAIGYALKNKQIKMILVSIISFFFHYATLPIAIFVIITYFWKSIKVNYLVIIYIILSFLYITGLQRLFLSGLPIGEFESYLQADAIEDFGGANKLSYLAFNTFWLVFFLFMFTNSSKDKVYLFLMKSYILFSIYFLIFGFIAYANRIASYSWFIIPLLLGYLIYKSRNTLLNIGILFLILVIGFLMIIPNFIL